MDLVSSGPSRGALMSDDWKWVLRSSQATRPVLRLLPVEQLRRPQRRQVLCFRTPPAWCGFRRATAIPFPTGSQQDLGTAFAVATSIYGPTRVQFSGNVGYSGIQPLPAAGFRTSYSRNRDGQSGPQVILTVRQLYLSQPAARFWTGADRSGPALRTMSLAMRDKVDLTDHLRLEYGVSMDSVNFLERLNYVSPFARATYRPGRRACPFGLQRRRATHRTGASSARIECGRPTELPRATNRSTRIWPRWRCCRGFRSRDDHVHVQRTQNFESGYQRVEGRRTYSAGVYANRFPTPRSCSPVRRDFLPLTDSLARPRLEQQHFQRRQLQSHGIHRASAKQALGDHMDASVAAGPHGRVGGGRGAGSASDTSRDAVRAAIHQVQDGPWMTASVFGNPVRSPAHASSSRLWLDRSARADAGSLLPDAGRQPIDRLEYSRPPAAAVLPRRWPAAWKRRRSCAICWPRAICRSDATGRKALLTNTPRAVRGGLAFIF